MTGFSCSALMLNVGLLGLSLFFDFFLNKEFKFVNELKAPIVCVTNFYPFS